MIANKSIIDTSAQNTLKNSMYNFVGFLVPIVMLVVFTPVIISHLGVKEYGIFIFINTILTFLGLIDLGIGIATNKHIVEYRSTNQTDRLQKLLYSMNSVYLLLACIYFFVCIGIGIVMQTFFIKPTTTENYFILLSIIGVSGFISTIFSNFSTSLVALQRYDLQIKISTTLLLLSNTSVLILAIMGYKLVPILLAQLIIGFLGTIIYYLTSKKIFPILKLKYEWNTNELISNYKYALPIAFNNVASSSLIHFDKLLIPVFLGAAPLTYYSVPGSIATKISSISGTFSSLLFPITVNLHALKNIEKIRRIYIRSIRLITILSSAIALSIIFTADKILLYWLSEDFAHQSVNVLIYLVLTNFILAIFSPVSNLLMAMNKMKFLTIGSISMAIINIIALFILLPLYGINGAAYAYLISVLFIVGMLHYCEKNFFYIHEKIHRWLFLKILLTTIPFYFIVKFLLYPAIISMITLVIIGPSCVLLFMLLYRLFGFVETEDWNDIKLSFSKVLVKLKIKKYE